MVLRMNAPVCICCGQPIAKKGRSHKGNPNICLACADLADTLEIQNQPRQTEAKTEPTKKIRKAA
jgi:recombinational DNA repair protein (RecF pathway)